MYWFWTVLSTILLLGFLAVGVFLLYSSLTGKGITPPDSNSSWQLRVQYKLRGVVGVAFTIFSLLVLYLLIEELLK